MEVNNNNLLHRLDRVIVPLNRTYQCSHICLYGQALAWSVGMLRYRYHQKGKVTHARYLGPVGGGNLVLRSYMVPGIPHEGQVYLVTMVEVSVRHGGYPGHDP